MKLLFVFLASLVLAFFLSTTSVAQDLTIPPDCGEIKFWQPEGYGVYPGGQELGCLWDVTEGDRPSAGDGDILYSRGAYLLVDGPADVTYMHLFGMPMPEGVGTQTPLAVRADLSLFGAVSGPSECYARGHTWNLEEAEFNQFFLLPEGTGLEDVHYTVDLTSIVDPGQIFTVFFEVVDKDMTDGIDCDIAVFVDGLLGAVGLGEVITSSEGPVVEVPASEFTLGSAYPNPFRGTTTVPFELSEAGEVSLAVYDILGRQVDAQEFGRLTAGSHSHRWEVPAGLPAGVYLIRLSAGEISLTSRVSVLPLN